MNIALNFVHTYIFYKYCCLVSLRLTLYSAFTELLANGTRVHLQHNYFVRDIFQLGPPPVPHKLSKSDKIEKVRRRELDSHTFKTLISPPLWFGCEHIYTVKPEEAQHMQYGGAIMVQLIMCHHIIYRYGIVLFFPNCTMHVVPPLQSFSCTHIHALYHSYLHLSVFKCCHPLLSTILICLCRSYTMLLLLSTELSHAANKGTSELSSDPSLFLSLRIQSIFI